MRLIGTATYPTSRLSVQPSKAQPEGPQRAGGIGGVRSILQFGNALWSSFTPAAVTNVPCNDNHWRLVKPLRLFSPASVTCVPSRFND